MDFFFCSYLHTGVSVVPVSGAVVVDADGVVYVVVVVAAVVVPESKN